MPQKQPISKDLSHESSAHGSPYDSLGSKNFWYQCAKDDDFNIEDIYLPRHQLKSLDRVGSAGSCFAQKISFEIKRSNLTFIDVEPTPPGMTQETAAKLGFGIYSARYGNIFTTGQWLQLIEDVVDRRIRKETLWQKKGRWFDGLRPLLEPMGFDSYESCIASRLAHLDQVERMFREVTTFIFTLGLTERWEHEVTQTVFPCCPASIDPAFGSEQHRFHNARVNEVVYEMEQGIRMLRTINPKLRFIFTVSPVPLSATATASHVLNATSRSKAVLRSAVDEILYLHDGCEYFPSYEMATQNPKVREPFYRDQRSIRPEVVDKIMSVFFNAHPSLIRNQSRTPDQIDTSCDEHILKSSSA